MLVQLTTRLLADMNTGTPATKQVSGRAVHSANDVDTQTRLGTGSQEVKAAVGIKKFMRNAP